MGLMKRMKKLGLSLSYLTEMMKDEPININPRVKYTDLRKDIHILDIFGEVPIELLRVSVC